jgi:hypothetical protein
LPGSVDVLGVLAQHRLVPVVVLDDPTDAGPLATRLSAWWRGATSSDREDLATAVEYGAAHGALAMTTPGDVSMATRAEVISLARGGGARVVR